VADEVVASRAAAVTVTATMAATEVAEEAGQEVTRETVIREGVRVATGRGAGTTIKMAADTVDVVAAPMVTSAVVHDAIVTTDDSQT